MATLLAACVVHALRPGSGTVGVTAIDKRPVDGPIKVGRYGLYADVQADRKSHGGLDQAVYAYSQADAEFWQAELDRELPFGWFGENLRVDGLDLAAMRPGERWRIGSVELEATRARNPCATFARWVGGADERGWVARFAAEKRLGVYLGVLKTGTLEPGAPIEVLSAPSSGPTILELNRPS